jgi:ubiquinone/menaquinone biosynthesis C-methylase UbiE
VNRYLGGTRAVMGHLLQWSKDWKTGEAVTILDVATGSADIPLAILRWSRERGFDVRVVGLDLHATTLALAREHVREAWEFPEPPQLKLVRGDALALPMADGSVDCVICSMFLHHLSAADAKRVVAEMVRVSRRGVIVNDLLRTWFARVGIFWLTVFADAIDKHDARVSVKKGWKRAEVEAWREGREAAEWLGYHHHVPARFTLAGQKPRTRI